MKVQEFRDKLVVLESKAYNELARIQALKKALDKLIEDEKQLTLGLDVEKREPEKHGKTFL
jgi:regulator of replication initiation timing